MSRPDELASTKGSRHFFGGWFLSHDLFFFQLVFFNLREISVGAFSGVENAQMWGLSPEMPKTGSPLAKGELRSSFNNHTWLRA
jgi:hypothetical protein